MKIDNVSDDPKETLDQIKNLIVRMDHRGYTHAYVSKEWLQSVRAVIENQSTIADK